MNTAGQPAPTQAGQACAGQPPPTQASYQATSLLIFGALSLLAGFILVTIVGILEFLMLKENPFLNLQYHSKNGYWPSTVSELVHNRESAGGRIFHTFGLISGLCFFLSWYPVHLRNVNTFEDSIWGPKRPLLYWTTFRQMVPVMGLWLLTGVNTFPMPVAKHSVAYTKLVCVFLHLAGAAALFLGYIACEAKCLGMWWFQRHTALQQVFERDKEGGSGRREERIRKCLVYVLLIAFVGFSACQGTLFFATRFEWDNWYPDCWGQVGDDLKQALGHCTPPADVSYNKTIHQETIEKDPQILNTASGIYLWIKIVSFCLENIAGIALVCSHWVVWYFCTERQLDHNYSDEDCRAPEMRRVLNYRACTLLVVGASTCIAGFLLITVVGLLQFSTHENKDLHKTFDSGLGYWPSTVSEMVHDRDSACGRVFFTLGMITGFSIFQSWYPIHLSNVNTYELQMPGGVYWTTFRQSVPMIGLWVLIGINTYPMQVAKASVGKTKMACVGMHLVGAAMMFMGYTLCELKCIGWFGFETHEELQKRFKENVQELRVRKITVVFILVPFVMFSICQVILFVSGTFAFVDIPTADKWWPVGEDNNTSDEPQIADTATGPYLWIKISSFVFEDIAGVALVLSHLLVWAYCDERKAGNIEELTQIARKKV